MSINLFLQSADRSAPVAASPEGPWGSVESAEGRLCPHLHPTEIQHWLFWAVLGCWKEAWWFWSHSSFCWLWSPHGWGDAPGLLCQHPKWSPVSTHVSWDACTAHNTLPDRKNRDFFSHCQEITPLPCARYRWDGGEKMHVHMHGAPKSSLCPEQVVRMLCMCGVLCVPSHGHGLVGYSPPHCSGPCWPVQREHFNPLLETAETSLSRDWHVLLDKALGIYELTCCILAGPSCTSQPWNCAMKLCMMRSKWSGEHTGQVSAAKQGCTLLSYRDVQVPVHAWQLQRHHWVFNRAHLLLSVQRVWEG